MATNLALDEKLLEEALKVGGHKSKKDTVNEALKEYVMKRKRGDILSLFGKVEMDPSYDYKKQRNRKEVVSETLRKYLVRRKRGK